MLSFIGNYNDRLSSEGEGIQRWKLFQINFRKD
mgnify:CR=1 FL=1